MPVLVLVLLVAVGCTTTDEVPESATEVSPSETSTAAGGATERRGPRAAPTEPSAEPPDTDRPGTDRPDPDPPDLDRADPEPPHPISVRALIETRYDSRGLRVGAVLGELGSYTRYAVTYRSESLRISGIMNVPAGRGPFPVLVLNHYIDPADYVSGQGLAREQDWLARRG